MLQLNSRVKLTQKRKRVGRGGSRGGTSGRGHKGQKARSGGSVPARFEGGQMSISRRLPKRGFTNYKFKTEYVLITLQQVDKLFEAEQTVTKDLLIEKGYMKKGQKVKLLATGSLEKKVKLEIDACSRSAKEAVERVGGEINLLLG